MRNISNYIKHPSLILGSARLRKYEKWMPSSIYLKHMYYANLGVSLNLKHPRNFNEKLQWLKLHEKSETYTHMVDKYLVKKIVADKLGQEYVVPLYGVWDKFNDIDFDSLPDKFVLKCTHDSAGLIICKDKSTLDLVAAKKKLSKCLKRNFYYSGREWPYKNVKPRIIAEAYMEDSRFHELRDYKFFTFNGIPKIVHVVTNRGNHDEPTYGDFFDMEYKHLDLTMGHDNAPSCPEKPICFDQMKQFAEILSKGTRHLRVDFYEVDGHLYFGELTFFQDSGFADIQPPEWNEVLGSWIDLN